MADTDIDLLKEMPLFGGLTPETLRLLSQSAPRITVRGHDYFFREGDAGEAMYVLQEGEVAVLKSWQGQTRELRRFLPGDSFGEMALIDLFPRSASVMAVRDSAALQLDNDLLLEIHCRDPEQFTLIQMNLARELSRRLRWADEVLFEFAMEARTPVKKVLRVL